MLNWLKKTASQALNWLNSSVVKPVVDTASQIVGGVKSGLSKPYNPNNNVFNQKYPNTPVKTTTVQKASTPVVNQQQVQKQQNANIVNTLKKAWTQVAAPKPTNWTAPKATIKPAWNAKPLLSSIKKTWDTGINVIANSKFGKTISEPFQHIWYEPKQKKDESDWLNRDVNTANQTFEKKTSELRSLEDAATTLTNDFKAGRISYRDAAAKLKDIQDQYEAKKGKIETLAKIYNDDFTQRSKDIQTPSPWSPGYQKIGKGLDFFWNKLNGIGLKPAWDIATWTLNFPNRGMNTFKNLLNSYGKPKEGYETPFVDPNAKFNGDSKLHTWFGNLDAGKFGKAWNKSALQKNPYWNSIVRGDDPRDFKRKLYDKWSKTAPGQVVDWTGENFVDPTLVAPNGAGFALFDEAKDFVKGWSSFKKLNTAWNKLNNPVANSLKWLGRTKAETASLRVQKQIEKIRTEVLADFVKAGVHTDDQAALFSRIMRGQPLDGVVSRGDLLRANNLVNKYRKKLDDMFNVDAAALAKQGFKLHLNPHYMPGKYADPNDVEKIIERSIEDLKNIPKFANRKKANAYSSTLEGISGDLARRTFASRKLNNTLLSKWEKTRNTISNVAHFPTKLWKMSVLGARPSWYINNASWNLPASIMGSGFGTLKSYGKIFKEMVKERKWTPKMLKDMPEAITGNGLFRETLGSKLGKPGSWLENLSRGAMYDTLKRKGFTDEEAIKQVNRYLFDYGNMRNWERPIQTVVPFWQWQKNIAKFTATMPLNNPRAFKLYNLLRQEFIEKPLKDIPDKVITFRDPDTKEEISYNPRDGYKGKIYIPGYGWRTVPFIPITPEQLDVIGLNPWLRISAEMLTGKNSYGQSFLGDNDLLDRVLNAFPQYQVGKAGLDWLNATKNPDLVTKKWISDSGYTKSRQGLDPTKSNYDKNLDPSKKFWSNLSNFAVAGWGNAKKFDKKDFNDKQRYNAFTQEYFSHDWDKEFTPDPNADAKTKQDLFDKKQAAQQAIAKKYGFDLNKDIYGDKWRKFDTTDTLNKKKGYETYLSERKNFYDTTHSFWEKFFATNDVDARMQMLLDNPQYMKDGSKDKILAGRAKHSFWQKFFSLGSLEEKMSYLRANPQFMKPATKVKLAFWDKYHSADKLTQRIMKRDNPQFFENLQTDPKTADMIWAFENLNPYQRKKYFAQKGYEMPKISYAEMKKIAKEKKDRDYQMNPWLKAAVDKKASEIQSTVRTKVKRGQKVVWTKKSIDKKVWKAT